MTIQRPVDPDIELARKMRRDAQDAIESIRVERVEEMLPLWERLRQRRVQNSFGEEYELSLTPRGTRPC